MKKLIAQHHTTLPSADAAEAYFTQLMSELARFELEGVLRAQVHNCSGSALVEVRPTWLSPRVESAVLRGSKLELVHETERAEGASVHSKVSFWELPASSPPPAPRVR